MFLDFHRENHHSLGHEDQKKGSNKKKEATNTPSKDTTTEELMENVEYLFSLQFRNHYIINILIP